MTRKRLPKAIVPRRGDLPETAANVILDEVAAEPHAAVQDDGTSAESPTPTISSPPVASDLLPIISTETQPAGGRRDKAQKIVERYRLYAAMGGLAPLPVVNVAGVTAIILRMVKVLSRLYDVPFERDRTRAMVVGLMGGAVPTGLATATASTLVFVMPASGLVGLAVSSFSAAAFTYGIGLVFIDYFENATTAVSTPAR
jgi:uncharacterized protein (DUF697 family)